jgi:nicotinate-nucleotide adenylyltransferase
MRTGIFGGTFNPVHIGHVRAAEAFVSELRLDRLFVIPNYIAPLKDTKENDYTSAEDRLTMLKIAFAEMKKTEISDLELKSGGTSYTYKTIAYLKETFPSDTLFLLIGDDNLLIFRKWVRFEYIIDNCTLCVAARSGADVKRETELLQKKYNANIKMLSFRPTVISSTELRGELNADYIPERVYAYIKEKGLYK